MFKTDLMYHYQENLDNDMPSDQRHIVLYTRFDNMQLLFSIEELALLIVMMQNASLELMYLEA